MLYQKCELPTMSSKKSCRKKLALGIKHLLLSENITPKELAKRLNIPQKELKDIMEQKKLPDILTFAPFALYYYFNLQDFIYEQRIPYKLSYIRANKENNIIAALRFLPDDIIEKILLLIFDHYNNFKEALKNNNSITID